MSYSWQQTDEFSKPLSMISLSGFFVSISSEPLDLHINFSRDDTGGVFPKGSISL